jgi:hypothetical protein
MTNYASMSAPFAAAIVSAAKGGDEGQALTYASGLRGRGNTVEFWGQCR